MTRAEIIRAIKDAWTRELMDAQEIGESVADSYSAWVQGIVQQAAADLQGQPAAQGGQGAQGGAPAAQGGAPPPDQGGGAEGGMA